MIVDLIRRVLTAEAVNAAALRETIAGLREANSQQAALITQLQEQDIIDEENTAQLKEAEELVKTRLAELEAVNPSPAADALAAEVVGSEAVETPAEISEDSTIGAPEPTSESAIEAISEAVPAITEAEAA